MEDGLESDTAYWECVSTPYLDREEPAPGLLARRQRSIRLFSRVLAEVLRHPEPLPGIDPGEETAFQLAQGIRIDPAWQQALLELRSECERLELVDSLLESVLERATGADL